MKILTNIRFVKVAGIAQTLSSFINFIEQSKSNRVKIVGVDLAAAGQSREKCRQTKGNFSLVFRHCVIPSINDVIKSAVTIEDVAKSYESIITAYQNIIKKQRPDVILINGTYYMPWCLLRASFDFSIPTIIHYHGSITKETEHWQQAGHRELFRFMERQFDNPKMFYIFPSNLTRELVENDIFGHRVKKYSILPNPVPFYFFKAKPSGCRHRVGIVGRWAQVKNVDFINQLAQYNAKSGGKFSLQIVSDRVARRGLNLNLSNLATFKRPMDNEKLVGFYASLGVLISPSHFETYGNVPKEALASGVPALISPHMGVAETFKKLGLHDWIVDFISVRKVYAKIKEIAGQPVPANVRAELLEQYGTEPIYGKMLNIIQSV